MRNRQILRELINKEFSKKHKFLLKEKFTEKPNFDVSFSDDDLLSEGDYKDILTDDVTPSISEDSFLDS